MAYVPAMICVYGSFWQRVRGEGGRPRIGGIREVMKMVMTARNGRVNFAILGTIQFEHIVDGKDIGGETY